MADDITHYDAVEAYCGRLSYRPGDTLTVHVRCTTETYDVVIERWGARRDEVWRASGLPGECPPTPADADAHGCGWPASISLEVPAGWRSGFYLVRLHAHEAAVDRQDGYAAFVVRATTPRSPALLVVATNTYHAYNNWGGRSLYTGAHRVAFDRPFGRGMLWRADEERDDRKAWPRRYGEAADVDGERYQKYRFAAGYPPYLGSAGWFTYERRFVEWAERVGYSLDFAVSSDLHDGGQALDGYQLVVGAGHDEYWSAGQRDAIEAFVAAGGNYASFSGNTMFWQVRLDDAGTEMVCHKYRAHLDDPVVAEGHPELMTGMWADPLVGRPETAVLGAGSAWGLYSRFGKATPRGSGAFTVYRSDHWMFAGTGLRYGDLLGADDGVVGYETVGCRLGFDDEQLPVATGGDGTPPGTEVLAFTPSSNLRVGEYPASIAALDDQGDAEFVAERIHGRVDEATLRRVQHGNAVIVSCRPFGEAGGTVVTVGSTDWVFGLAGDDAVGTVTGNVLRRLGSAQ